MSVLKVSYASMSLFRTVNLEVILPVESYGDKVQAAQKPKFFKTLYLLNGFGGNQEDWLDYSLLRNLAEKNNLAIVLPAGENSFYEDQAGTGGQHGELVGKELVEFTRRILPLSTNREDTYIGGLSMGGYGALYNGAIYNKLFSKVAVLSPSADCYDLIMNHPQMFDKELFENTFGSKHDYYSSDWDLNNIYRRLPCEQVPKLLIACGEQDDLVGAGVERFRGMLKKAGIPFVDYRGEGNHEFGYWSSQLDKLFSFLAGIKPGTKTKLVVNEGVK